MTASRIPRSWLFTCVLYLPVVLFYAAHYAAQFRDPDAIPTGFVQYDQPYYMASAKEFVDGGSSGLLYSIPSSPDYHSEPVLCQLHIWFLGQVLRITGMDPGLLFVLFGGVFGLLCVRVFQQVFDLFIPVQGAARAWGHALFLWGGGAFAVIGYARGILHGVGSAAAFQGALQLDPGDGWWMLNLGRNLIYPNEAYYHFMFFSSILLVAKNRYSIATLVIGLLAFSHPFAGMGCLVIFFAWALAERFYVRNKQVPLSFVWMLGALLATAGYYYFAWVPRHEDKVLLSSFELNFDELAVNFIPGYLLVGTMAFMRLRTPVRLRVFAGDHMHRFLLLWAVVNFMLENHEFAIKPHQPLHFTRGYTWSALFLIGAPWLIFEVWPWITRRSRLIASVLMISISAVMIADNTAFFVLYGREQYHAGYQGFWISRDERDALHHLDALYDAPVPLIAQDIHLAYMSMLHTPFRPYRSHSFDDADDLRTHDVHAAYFKGHILDPVLSGPLMVVADRSAGDFIPPGRSTMVYENSTYRIFRVTAGPSPADGSGLPSTR